MIMPSGNIFNEFRHGVFYEEIYKKYRITEKQLIFILQRNIKGKYDYKRILSGGIEAQKQFNKHLSNRWNPLDPDAPWEPFSPYLERDYDKKTKKSK
jgi:hypothetical protein